MHSEDFNFSAEYESQKKKKSHFQPVQNNAALNLNLTHSSPEHVEKMSYSALYSPLMVPY